MVQDLGSLLHHSRAQSNDDSSQNWNLSLNTAKSLTNLNRNNKSATLSGESKNAMQ